MRRRPVAALQLLRKLKAEIVEGGVLETAAMHAQHQPRRLHRAFNADRLDAPGGEVLQLKGLDAPGGEVLQLKGRIVRDQRPIPERARDRPGQPRHVEHGGPRATAIERGLRCCHPADDA